MSKNYVCRDCGWYGRQHDPSCQSKGYLIASPPKSDGPPTERIRVECPCGIHRDDCEYHALPTFEYGSFDSLKFDSAAPAPVSTAPVNPYAGHQTGKHATCPCAACVKSRARRP